MKYSNEVINISETLQNPPEISVFDFINNYDEIFDTDYKGAKQVLRSIKKDLKFYKNAYMMLNIAKSIIPNPDYLQVMGKDELDEMWNKNIDEIKYQLDVLKKLEKSLITVKKTEDYNTLELIIITLGYICKVRDSIAENYKKDEKIFAEEILPDENNIDNSWIVRDAENVVLQKLIK